MGRDDAPLCDGGCRRRVEVGSGQQFVEARGAVTRLCDYCTRKRVTVKTKDIGRQRKAVCGCGRILRGSRKVLAEGDVLCGLCGSKFVMDV